MQIQSHNPTNTDADAIRRRLNTVTPANEPRYVPTKESFRQWFGASRRYRRGATDTAIANFENRTNAMTKLANPGPFFRCRYDDVDVNFRGDVLNDGGAGLKSFRRQGAMHLAYARGDVARAKKINGGWLPSLIFMGDSNYSRLRERVTRRSCGFSQLVMNEKAIACDLVMQDILTTMRGEAA